MFLLGTLPNWKGTPGLPTLGSTWLASRRTPRWHCLGRAFIAVGASLERRCLGTDLLLGPWSGLKPSSACRVTAQAARDLSQAMHPARHKGSSRKRLHFEAAIRWQAPLRHRIFKLHWKELMFIALEASSLRLQSHEDAGLVDLRLSRE